MRVLKRLGKVLSLLALVLGVSAIMSTSVMADERPDYRLQVSPSKLELDLAPGKTVEKSFQVQNTGNKEFGFTIEASVYSVADENYDPDYNATSTYTDLAKWVTFSQTEGTVGPNETVKIDVRVDVPKDIPAGGQYAAIMVTMVRDDEEDGGQGVSIGTIQRIGLVMYSTVEGGNTRREGKIIDNKVASFRFNPPITATSTVENTGNVHATATYILQVYPLFSSEEVYSNEENPETGIILPETKRYNEVSWPDAPHLGIFKVKQTVKFLNEEKVTEKLVFLCPIWFLFIILLLIFAIVFWIVSRVRGRRA